MSGVPVPSGEATTRRPAFARAEFASGRKSFRMFRVVDLSVEAPVPYGGSVAIASIRVTGMFRASPLISPDGSIWKYLRFLRSEEHTSELQSHHDLVCRLLLEKKK